ncbi:MULTISPECIES: lipid kinase YegS [Tatumella]|uniref:Probable lipid kinase YegS-like n=1 Tax=Tatumella punctata TaxID=399969 RepID=A0ABW1VKH7_9GAMM|nr:MULTISPECIES: lipid kinase YegS [unclassified Tatumella]MBS0854804.1 lipid kinase YegS [Tatumella sp. JGM16]MBS0892958.1 lipid kinase YegS [Tatumella sp. JGM130]MBS0912234.1 lipid kinase YegS [Tatumella sp. JGM91]
MNSTSKAVVILNGKSAANEQLRQAVIDLRAGGYQIEVRVTWEAGDTQRYLQEALSLQADTVIAGGGDGTINQLVSCLAQLPPAQRPVLGILPLGTANDFARSAGIPEQMAPALQLAVSGTVSAVDIVTVNRQRYFINMATGGFGTRITTETPDKLKAALGGVSYVIHGLLRMDTLKADHCEIISETFHWQGDALVIGIGNGRQAGGGQRLCPSAFINDGLMDISIVTAQQWLPGIVHNLTGNSDNPAITSARCRSLEIKARHPMTFNLDGEPLSGEHFRMELLPQAVRCRLPEECPLLSHRQQA